MFALLATRPINHLLARNSWALARLKPFAGKTARFECVPFAITLGIRPDGQVELSATGEPDVTIRSSPGVVLRLAARDETAWQEVSVSGDTDFAAALDHVCRNLQWDVEEDLARVFGDVVAHRMMLTAGTFQDWGGQAADNLARSFAEYWTEEQPLIARAADVEEFNREVDRLRDAVARLEKRMEMLATRNETTRPAGSDISTRGEPGPTPF